MKIVAFLPAKGSSDRIENKNIKLLDGKPLFLHTLEKLVNCNFIDEVYLDTESDEIINMAENVDCKILKRDSKLASNKTDGNKLFMNEVAQVDADIYIQVLCTSPFIQESTIKTGLDNISNSEEYDSAVLVAKEKLYKWEAGKPLYDLDNIPNSSTLEESIIETMGIYIIKREAALKTKRRIGKKPYFLNASPIDKLDVNWPEEFEFAELVAAGLREKERKLLKNLKNLLNSPMLSDLLDDLGYPNQIIKGLTPNINNSRIIGRAKTLKLRKLQEGEAFEGIYTALKSYNTIIPDDIILVENEVPDYAYFGELNANLAIRCGAAGAIIGGKTRDTNFVSNINFPVFATGSVCQDVRKRATVESINKPIEIQGVRIAPDQLIFADSDGIAVIPKEIEATLIELVYDTASKEKFILTDISLGVSTDEIIKKHGFF